MIIDEDDCMIYSRERPAIEVISSLPGDKTLVWHKYIDNMIELKSSLYENSSNISLLKKLINYPKMSQSGSIKAGILIGDIFWNLATQISDPTDIEILACKQVEKGKTYDLLMLHHHERMLRQWEIKTNCEFDSEKVKKVEERLAMQELRSKFPDFNFVSGILLPFWNTQHFSDLGGKKKDLKVNSGYSFVEDFCRITNIPLDFHLYIQNMHKIGKVLHATNH